MSRQNLRIHRSTDGKTAQFNTQTRVLTLPIWSLTSAEDQMLVIHEVGHALYTPAIPLHELSLVRKRFPNKQKISAKLRDFINIVEDVRIDRLMSHNFPGAVPTIRKAYISLDEREFFGSPGTLKEQLPFIDRANLHFKLGMQGQLKYDFSFSPEEQVYIDRMWSTRSFDEVVSLALELFDNKPPEEQSGEDDQKTGGKQKEEGEKKPGERKNQKTKGERKEESEQKQDDEDQNDENEEQDDENEEQDNENGERDNEERVNEEEERDNEQTAGITARNFSNALLKSAPTKTRVSTFVPTKMVSPTDPAPVSLIPYRETETSTKSVNWSEFRPLVNMMYADFMRLRKAKELNKTSEHRRGVIDTRHIAMASVREDIFRRQTETPSGTRHGLFLIVDYSSSMTDTISAVWRQVYVLISFCRLAKIPYTVAVFSTHHSLPFFVSVLDQTMSMAETEQRLSFFAKEGLSYYRMGGTPLNAVTKSLIHYIPKFKQKYDLERVAIVFLTDGGATDSNVGMIHYEMNNLGRCFSITSRKLNAYETDGGFIDTAFMVKATMTCAVDMIWWLIEDDDTPGLTALTEPDAPRDENPFSQYAVFKRQHLIEDFTTCRLMLQKFIKTIA
jgi:hypothetical protein